MVMFKYCALSGPNIQRRFIIALTYHVINIPKFKYCLLVIISRYFTW